MYKFQKNLSLNRSYETMINIEKQKIDLAGGVWLSQEPMDRVARKIRKGQELDLADTEAWMEYNYLVLSDEDQETIQGYIKRQRRCQTYVAATAPVMGFMAFALNKYHFKFGLPANCFICCAFIFGFERTFTHRLKQDKFRDFTSIYKQNMKEVQDQKFRGLKLYRGKHANKIDNKDFTTSNLDDLKLILNN